MRLHVLGSSSKGNSYLLQSETTGEVLILEAGINLEKVKKALDFNISSIVGCCVTHEHGDHAKYVLQYLNARIPIRMSEGTMQKTIPSDYSGLLPLVCDTGSEFRLGSFDVIPFDVQHDAEEPLGFLIRHQECGTILFATDTYYLKYKFAELTNILIECNYRLDILNRNTDAGRISPIRRERTVKSHMSYETCLETLLANDLSQVNNIILIHLSGDNSHTQEFVRGIAKATHKNVTAAYPGLNILFNKTPF
ncbi:MBL fold metallo-hydrolase [Hoylesella nanceiensis]|jgi:hypothetical protein|uniref:MBL fold metallo-hydrolase n=1 Tax=Hoylesella nanceiensis TaxID=425941 RepID=UPI0028E8C585|nr:MBL fold metallo-hydrolase [Hoylesella nanceiensis]